MVAYPGVKIFWSVKNFEKVGEVDPFFKYLKGVAGGALPAEACGTDGHGGHEGKAFPAQLVHAGQQSSKGVFFFVARAGRF